MVVEDECKWLPADDCTQVMKVYSVMWLKFIIQLSVIMTS